MKNYMKTGGLDTPFATNTQGYSTTDLSMKLNSPAPDFTLFSTHGEQITLSEILKNGNALLVFLRHLG
jgi:hypothetical protein